MILSYATNNCLKEILSRFLSFYLSIPKVLHIYLEVDAKKTMKFSAFEH